MIWAETIKLLKEGKKVKRVDEVVKGRYLTLEENTIKWNNGHAFSVSYLSWFTDNGWEEYIEEDNWNLKDSYIQRYGVWCSDLSGIDLLSIKKLRTKILEDIKKAFMLGDPFQGKVETAVKESVNKRFGFKED